MEKLLFICLGNICRSPAAEGIMRAKVEERYLFDDIMVDSAGIGSWHVGERPDRRMMKHAARRGYDLSTLRARQFRSDDFDKFDRIIVMDEDNYEDVMDRMPYTADEAQRQRYISKVVRMRDYFQRYRGETTVPDPYYGGDQGFEHVLDLLEDGCEGLLHELVNE